jgi:hypothetical protein
MTKIAIDFKVGEKLKSKKFRVLQTIDEIHYESSKVTFKCITVEGISNWATYMNKTKIKQEL